MTLTGENSFGLGHALAKLTTDFVAEHGDLALERIDGESADYDQMRETLQSMPFLASHKMVVLRRPGANKTFVEKAEELLAGIGDETTVVIVEPKLDKRQSYYKFLSKKTDFTEYKALDQAGLVRWLVTEAAAQGAKLPTAAANYLVERVGTDQQLLSNELTKVALYDPSITRATIELMTEATPQSTIFQLLEAAFAGNRPKTLALYAEQRALKVEPQQIIALLGWQLHVLALVVASKGKSADAIASEAKVSPFVVRKTQGMARRVSLADARRLVYDLTVLDLRCKRQPIDLDEALQLYLLTIAS